MREFRRGKAEKRQRQHERGAPRDGKPHEHGVRAGKDVCRKNDGEHKQRDFYGQRGNKLFARFVRAFFQYGAAFFRFFFEIFFQRRDFFFKTGFFRFDFCLPFLFQNFGGFFAECCRKIFVAVARPFVVQRLQIFSVTRFRAPETERRARITRGFHQRGIEFFRRCFPSVTVGFGGFRFGFFKQRFSLCAQLFRFFFPLFPLFLAFFYQRGGVLGGKGGKLFVVLFRKFEQHFVGGFRLRFFTVDFVFDFVLDLVREFVFRFVARLCFLFFRKLVRGVYVAVLRLFQTDSSAVLVVDDSFFHGFSPLPG